MDAVTPEDQQDLINELCKGRCNFQFSAIRQQDIQIPNGQESRILEGVLYCTVCTALKDCPFTFLPVPTENEEI